MPKPKLVYSWQEFDDLAGLKDPDRESYDEDPIWRFCAYFWARHPEWDIKRFRYYEAEYIYLRQRYPEEYLRFKTLDRIGAEFPVLDNSDERLDITEDEWTSPMKFTSWMTEARYWVGSLSPRSKRRKPEDE